MNDKDNHRFNGDLVDTAIDAVRSGRPSQADIQAASDRVRATLADQQKLAATSVKQLNSIENYIELIPDYLANKLNAAQTLLFEEESRQSIPLRRALDQARRPPPQTASDRNTDQNTGGIHLSRWLAAAAAVAIVTAVMMILPQLPSLDQSRLVQVEDINGKLFLLSEGRLQALQPGMWIDGQQDMRTGTDSTALLVLDDGSRIEVNERTELSFMRRFSGNRIEVDRGRIIVSAAPQAFGTLDVTTNEFIVSVTGTIFEVRHGAMGSRVSVIEGEVEVYQHGDSISLRPGEQMGSRTGFAATGFETEIAWSRDADHYIDMLQQVRALQREIGALMATQPRYSTRLLDLVPAATAIYIAVPNAPAKIADVYDLLRSRMQEGQRLKRVWADVETASADQSLDQLMSWLREVGDHLGDETVAAVVLRTTERGTQMVPVVLSEVDAAAFEAGFDAKIEEIRAVWAATGQSDDLHVALIDDPADAVTGQLSIWLHQDLLVASVDAQVMQEMHQSITQQSNAFVGSDFHAVLLHAYQDGAQFLGAVDLAQFFALVSPPSAEMAAVGLDNARYLVVERSHQDERASIVADLLFEGERNGVASWLAAPGAMGSLEFFSVDATLASAIVVKDPAQLIDEMAVLMQQVSGNPEAAIQGDGAFGADIRDDLFAALGGEAAFGLDGPMLPRPSWKVVVEVYDEQRLQQSIERIIDRLNEQAVQQQTEFTFLMSSANISGYSGYQISLSAEPGSRAIAYQDLLTLHYAYLDGYFIAAPSIALVGRAIDYYQSGGGLLTDDEFRGLLPQQGYLDFSAVAFNRVGQLIAEMVEKLPSQLSAEQQQTVQQLSQASGPSLYAVYAEPSSIRFVQTGGTEVPLGIAEILSLQSIFGAYSGDNLLKRLLNNAGSE